MPGGVHDSKSYRTLGRGVDGAGVVYEIAVPDERNAEKTYQGMFSGHRGTNFDNTMLNIGYFNTAVAAV